MLSFSLFMLFLSFFHLGASETIPVAAHIYSYPPFEYCDLENPRDQESFYGQEVELALSIINNTQWLGENQYEFEFYCVCCFSVLLEVMTHDFDLEEVGRKYMFTVYLSLFL